MNAIQRSDQSVNLSPKEDQSIHCCPLNKSLKISQCTKFLNFLSMIKTKVSNINCIMDKYKSTFCMIMRLTGFFCIDLIVDWDKDCLSEVFTWLCSCCCCSFQGITHHSLLLQSLLKLNADSLIEESTESWLIGDLNDYFWERDSWAWRHQR